MKLTPIAAGAARTALRFVKKLLPAVPDYLREMSGISGVALIAYGAYQIYRPAGFIALGVQLLAGAWLAGRAKAQSDDE